EDLYSARLIPNAPGGPRLYYTGKNASAAFGIMGAVSSGDEKGPWTRLSDSHLLEHGISFLCDAWYADGKYHFLYFPGGTTPGGIFYATSDDGLFLTIRRQILARRPGEWDANPAYANYVVVGSTAYLIVNGSSGIGIGYVYAPV